MKDMVIRERTILVVLEVIVVNVMNWELFL